MFRLISLRLLESYFRHRWLHLLPIFLMGMAAVSSMYLLKPKYIVRGAIFVQKRSLLAQLTSVPGPEMSWQTPASITVGELKELLQTESFMRAVIHNTDLEPKMSGGATAVGDTILEARTSLWVSAGGDNQVVIGAMHENAHIALQLVKGVSDVYLQWKINSDRADSQVAHTFFTNLIAQYKAQVDIARKNLYDYLEAHPAPIKGERPPVEQLEISRLQAELNMVQSRYTGAIDKDENAQLAAAQAQDNVVQSFVIIDSPTLPEKPEVSLKQTVLEKALYVVFGLMMSFIGVVGGAVLDRSFRFPIDVVHSVNLPVLAAVPLMRPARRSRKPLKLRWPRKAKAVPPENPLEIGAPALNAGLAVVDNGLQSRSKRRRRSKNDPAAESPALGGGTPDKPGAPSVMAGINPEPAEPINIQLKEAEKVPSRSTR